MVDLFKKIKKQFKIKPELQVTDDKKIKPLNTKQRVGLPGNPIQKTKRVKSKNETCEDDDVLKLLEDIISYDNNLLRGTGIQKLSNLYRDEKIYDKDNVAICTKSPSQKRYIEYIKEMTIQLQRLMEENDRTIVQFDEAKKNAERETKFAREEASMIDRECRKSRSEDQMEKNRIQNELNKSNEECENKIQKLKPKIKIVGGIPRTPQRKTPTKQSLSPRAKEAAEIMTKGILRGERVKTLSPQTLKVMKEENERKFREGTPELGALPSPRSSIWPKVKQNF
jgi:hypothetical protein